MKLKDKLVDGPRGESTWRAQRWLTLVVLVIANALVIGLTIDSLLRSLHQHERDARNLTQNVTNALDLNVSKSIEKVDLVLRAVVDELERQLAGKGIAVEQTNTFLALQEQRLPEVEAFRVSRSDGTVILGRGVVPGAGANWADREDFAIHRAHADSGLQISKARMGRVARQFIVGLSRRYNHPDGSFAGTVSAPIAVDQFTRLLSQFDVGSKGTLILRDAELGLITRVPSLPDNLAGQVGSQVVSADFRRVFDTGQRTATDYTTQSPDGYQRIFTFHRLQAAPMVTIVAVSTQDYLKGWTEEVYRASAMAGAFLVLSIVFGVSLIYLLRRTEQHSRKLHEGKTFISDVLDSLSEHIAVIDERGVITAVNASWRRFADENGVSDDAVAFVGTNYLDVCARSMGRPRGEESVGAYEGIKAVLGGARSGFSLKYPCHSSHQQRWFILHVMPLIGANNGAVLIHQNVTDQHRAEVQLRGSEAHFRMLAENMADIVWRADAEMRFTYINDADRVLRGFDRSEVLGQPISDVLTPLGKDLLTDLREQRRQAEASGVQGIVLNFEIPMLHKNGGDVWIDLTTVPIYDSEGKTVGFQGIGRDITERKKRDLALLEKHHLLEDKLNEATRQSSVFEDLALHDPLTGIHNRRYLQEGLPRQLARAGRDGFPVAVIMIDLDHFKQINDSYSHAAGDLVLKTVSSLLKNKVRESDLICRYGGEEFLVVMPNMNAGQAFDRVEEWRSTLQAQVIVYGEFSIRVTMSAGIAEYPVHGETPEVLIDCADTMLYRSKSQGRNRSTVCDRV